MNEQDIEREIIPWQIVLILFFIALLAPYQIIFRSSSNILQILAPLYVYFPIGNTIHIFQIEFVINTLQYIFFRFVFVFQVGRFYKNAISRRKLIAFGILGEIPSFLITILYILQPILSGYPLVIGIPFPIVVFIVIYLLRRYPQPILPLTWKGHKKVVDWWPEIDAPRKNWD